MNSKPTQSKPNKQEFSKQLIPRRARSVFNDVTNTNNQPVQENQNFKRRNALIPIPNNEKPLSMDVCLYSKKQTYNVINENWKGTISFLQNYEKEIQEYEYEIELKVKQSMEQHHFHETQLESALKWMVQQISQFKKTSHDTAFQAIEMVYQFLQGSFNLQFADLQLITGCCMYLASKVVDLSPIYVGDILFEVLSNKFTNDEIIKTENRICQVLRYNLLMNTPLQSVYRILFENKKILENYYEQGQIQILTQKIIQNLLQMVIRQRFRSATNTYKAVSSILLVFMEHKVDLRIVRI